MDRVGCVARIPFIDFAHIEQECAVADLGESIQIARFARFAIGENTDAEGGNA